MRILRIRFFRRLAFGLYAISRLTEEAGNRCLCLSRAPYGK